MMPALGDPKGNNPPKGAIRLLIALITDPQHPTRTGMSVVRDTTTDLGFIKNVSGARWRSLQENIGNGHFIRAITLAVNTLTYPFGKLE